MMGALWLQAIALSQVIVTNGLHRNTEVTQ